MTVAGVGGVPADAEAVALNVTVTSTTASSFLSVWPNGQTQPTVSSLNWSTGWTTPNAVTVKVGADGKVKLYNWLGSAHVIVDVVGYYKAGVFAGFTSLDPVRILDSRPQFQVGPYSTPWGEGITRDVTVAGVGGVPADAEAVALNVTVTSTTASSFLSVWPNGQTQPTVSSLNWSPGWTRPNAVTVKVGADGKVKLYNWLGSAHLIVDVVGYFKTGSGVEFHPLDPARILDSRPQFQVGPYSTPWGEGMTRDVKVTAVGGVPDNAQAVLMNATVTSTTASSFLSVWPNGQTQPTVSSLNWLPGWTIPNSVAAKVGTDGNLSVYNWLGTTHVVSDVAGWYG